VRARDRTVTAFAPASISNVGAGFDAFGCAITGAGDTVHARLTSQPGVVVASSGHPSIPTEASRNTAGIAARETLRRAGANDAGVELRVEKGLPLSGGQGGSAASAAAAAVAVNALLESLPRTQRGAALGAHDLLEACLTAEEAVAGRHADNVAPALLGGFVIVRAIDPTDIVALPTPDDLRIVIAHPAYEMRTAEARSVLPAQVTRAVAVAQAANAAATVAALAAGDYDLLRRSLVDLIAEPVRAPLLPGFREARDAALDAGAYGSSISGSGPTVFALARGDAAGTTIAGAMRRAYEAAGIRCAVRVSRVDHEGARVVAGGAA